MEIVISLLLFLGDPPILKEPLFMQSVGACFDRPRLAHRSTNNAEFRCSKVKAVVKDGKIISIASLD